MFRITPLLGDFRPKVTQVPAVGNTWTRLVLANPDRAILYLPNPTNTAAIYFAPPGFQQSNNGLFQVQTGASLRFTWGEDGPMSTLEWWYFFPSISASTIVAVEWIWLP